MNVWVLLLAAVGCAVGAPQFGAKPQARPQPGPPAPARQPQPSHNPEAHAKILRHDQDVQYDGKFSYGFETDNGIAIQADGELKPIGNDFGQVIHGEYSFKTPDGVPVVIKYVADEGGFRAEGDAIPTPPPIPPEIARALEYIRSLPPSKESQQI